MILKIIKGTHFGDRRYKLHTPPFQDSLLACFPKRHNADYFCSSMSIIFFIYASKKNTKTNI